MGKRLSIASDVSWASEARQTSSVKVMHDMVSRVKNLEARLQACRDLVNPLLDSSPTKDGSPTKELLLTSPEKSLEKDILGSLPRRPQSQLSNYPSSERYRIAPRTPSSSRRLTFGRPKSRQSDLEDEEGDVTITLERTANITPRNTRRTNHHKTMSSLSRPSSRLSNFSLDHDDPEPFRTPSAADMRAPSATGIRAPSATGMRPPSATGRRQSGIPAPSDRRQSGIPAPRRQSGIPAPRPVSPTRSTSSSSFHSDTMVSVTSPTTSNGSMGAPSLKVALARRQSGAVTGLPVPKTLGRKSLGTGIPVPRS